MANKSTGIVLTATAISFGNEWVQTGKLNFKIPIAGSMVAFIFNGVSDLNESAGTGLSILMFIAVMLTPFNGKAPAEELASLVGTTKTNLKVMGLGDSNPSIPVPGNRLIRAQ